MPRGQYKRKQIGDRQVTLICKCCEKPFTAGAAFVKYDEKRGHPRQFCSRECYFSSKRIPHPTDTCETCGKVTARVRVYSKKGKFQGYRHAKRFCSRDCQTKASETVSGFFDKHGYRLVRRNGRDVPEHRDVMEKIIGRSLFPDETVHHKNGNRADNRPENLELWSSRHGKGQRVEDKIDFCRSFMSQYGRSHEHFSVSEMTSGMLGFGS